ncbi:P-loop containing nucleoside triphosphate hydrolase protein [Aureobasidium namibiae CBS 147.97]|uniref:p-loop containing nucleoside triphosphate hydrolase protein n=1 Tax=Aureobasidium namibiae CBS 147.97 TaxID=1043004 RepID=A0A074WPF7_9PEZI|nr:P-loop containing nucleoside triphosphate hydrolase protein [Aureobasidium namibiae CBS 147.97]KEQ75020.1 P-loop containing nucleoside triphosphate hydrolase protein [Aureobasidium namibiae CBS 147.97]
MDLFYLGRQLITALPSGNGTDVTDLPIKLLEAFVPGYSLFANAAQQWLGFDLRLIMSCIAFFFIAKSTVDFVWSRVYKTLLDYFTSSVHIDGRDDLYTTVLEWISATRPDLSKRSLTARTQYGNQYDSDDEEEADAYMLAKVAVGDHGYFNFSKTASRVPPRYEPDHGQFWFSTPHGTFQFKKNEYTTRGSDGLEHMESCIDLSCIGLTTNPIKLLLNNIKAWTVRKEGSKTIIRVPADERWNGWMRSSERPSRNLDTVILDPEQKSRILQDMNEYLHPLSSKWYASRGIPYRRGYLFSGPPGTGKTSLSFSLAGIFGLDIHIINLMDPSMSENTLSKLFNNLPKRCIVLFEDIDAAGIKKRVDESDSESDAKRAYDDKDASKAEIGKGKSKSRATRRADSTSPSPSPPRKRHRKSKTSTDTDNESKISLSGLLNVIDGVATHEGRILIMTTNHPEKLDPALIRAGRVDMQISFSYATASQIRSLFLRMYAGDNVPSVTAKASGLKTEPMVEVAGKIAGSGDAEPPLAKEELEDLSVRFAAELPEGRFAPSDVQGYLLLYRKKPREAVDKVGVWRDAKLVDMAEKEKNKSAGKKVKRT